MSLLSTALATYNSSTFHSRYEASPGCISPVKGLEPKIMTRKSICCRITLCRRQFHFVPHCVTKKPLALCRNINTIAIPMPDTLLHASFYKNDVTWKVGRCAPIFLMYSRQHTLNTVQVYLLILIMHKTDWIDQSMQ